MKHNEHFLALAGLLVANDKVSVQRQFGKLEKIGLDQTLDAIDWHRLVLPVYATLRKHDCQLPANFSLALKNRYRQHKMNLLGLQEAQINVTKLFNDHDVAHLHFKGAVLSELLYGNAELRHSKDVDVWVDEADVERAVRILTAAGYYLVADLEPLDGANYQQMMTVRKDLVFISPSINPIELELHWRLDKNRYAYGMEFSSIIRKEFRQSIKNHNFSSFDRHDYISYLAIHGGMAMWGRLKWLQDWHSLVALLNKENFDWQHHCQTLEQAGRLQFTLLAVNLSQQVFGQLPPNGVPISKTNWFTRVSEQHIIRSLIKNKYPSLVSRWLLRLFLCSANGYKKEQFSLFFKMLINPRLRV